MTRCRPSMDNRLVRLAVAAAGLLLACGSPPASTDDGGDTSDGSETHGGACGNGVIDVDEQCDNGDANSDLSTCTSQCVLASCGDGLVYQGQELCDDGNAAA